jgi:hypothetical protein
MPSVLYKILRPVITDEVSRFMQPGRGVCVDGEEVEIKRACCLRFGVIGGGDTPDFAIGVGFDAPGTLRGGDDLIPDEGFMPTCGLTWVCIRVFTTSNGHVITPASPPAAAPVRSSSGNPISLLFFHCRAHVCPCS